VNRTNPTDNPMHADSHYNVESHTCLAAKGKTTRVQSFSTGRPCGSILLTLISTITWVSY